jgi:hypothetical protein
VSGRPTPWSVLNRLSADFELVANGDYISDFSKDTRE